MCFHITCSTSLDSCMRSMLGAAYTLMTFLLHFSRVAHAKWLKNTSRQPALGLRSIVWGGRRTRTWPLCSILSMGNCTEMMLPFLPNSLWSSWWTLYARTCKTQAYAVLRLELAQVDLRVRQVLSPVAALHQDGSRTGLSDVLECWQMATAQAREAENGDKPTR